MARPEKKTVLIIGAGPAGLTAAYELLTRTEYVPIVIEQANQVGGLSKSVRFGDNRLDIGPHRFFSKSDRVMDWWLERLPLEKIQDRQVQISYRGQERQVQAQKQASSRHQTDHLMLLVDRKTRIYYQNNLFDYPVKLNLATIRNLGWLKMSRIGLSYGLARLHPRQPERSLEDFFINRFGQELYTTFFENYTEKVWGLHPSKISSEWGAQRVKGLSLTQVLVHFVQQLTGVGGKTETSLVEQFLYPKLGAGQMWEVVADQVRGLGGSIRLGQRVKSLELKGKKVIRLTVEDVQRGKVTIYQPGLVFSTMPIKELVAGMSGTRIPQQVSQVAAGLQYRDMINAAVLLQKLKLKNVDGKPLKDNWLYIQDPKAKVGRVQIGNNMSPFLVAQKGQVLIGAEYFLNQTDSMWRWSDKKLRQFVLNDLAGIGLIDPKDVLKVKLMRLEKTYPAYFGTYDQIETLVEWINGVENLYLLGRNGMHKYNNQDHSMLTAMVAVDNLVAGRKNKRNIWEVNVEEEYHEEK